MSERQATAKILLIDDDPSTLGLLEILLRKHGYAVYPSPSAEFAVQLTKRYGPELILLDVMMPRVDGYEACTQLKADSLTRDIPVIFLTSLHELKEKVKGFQVGAVDYISKPVEPTELLARVHTHVTGYRTQRELKQMKEAAEEANRAKSQFLANMNHELRTPLNAIIGFSQLISLHPHLDPDVQEYLQIIHRSGQHLLALINQILDLSKIEAGHIAINEYDFDLFNLLNELKEMFRFRAARKQLNLIFRHASDTPQYICTDEVKLRQILINLLSNAIKFTKEGAVILKIERCQLNSEEQHETPSQSSIINLRCSISDTGPGIAQEEIGQLFREFQQTETGRQLQEGTGLGLAISQKFVQLLGGELHVQSQIGEGTEFSFTIQVKNVTEFTPVRHRNEKRIIGLEPVYSGTQILIVDDNQESRKLLRDLLSPLGFRVQEARNGLEALDLWKQWRPDLVLIDLRMPVLDGYEAAQRIRQEEAEMNDSEAPIPIIAVTAGASMEDRSRILAAGCDDVINKPFHTDAIFQMLHTYLGVQYRYSEEILLQRGATAEFEREIHAEDLNVLPPELLNDLEQAIHQLHPQKILKIIEAIEGYHAPFAKMLNTLAYDFDYDTILQLIRHQEKS